MISVCGRKIKVQTGAKSQTVNICTNSNIHGEYEYIVRLRPPSPSLEILLTSHTFNSMREVVEYLETNHRGRDREIAEFALGIYNPSASGMPPASRWRRRYL